MSGLLTLAVAVNAWFATFATASHTTTCHGAVIRTGSGEFAVATARHCIENIHSVSTVAHDKVKVQGGKGAFVEPKTRSDYAVVLAKAAPGSVKSLAIGSGDPKWIVVTRQGAPADIEVKRSAPGDMAEFAERCKDDPLCAKCSGRLTVASSDAAVVKTDSGAAVLNEKRELLGVISTRSYGGVASYCAATLPDCTSKGCSDDETKFYIGPKPLKYLGRATDARP